MDDGFGGIEEKWESTANPLFTTFFKGLTDQLCCDVFAQAGSIPPGNFDVNTAQAIGAGDWTNVFSGNVQYNGVPTGLILEAALRNQLLADFDGGVVGRVPDPSRDQISGYTLFSIIPEPTGDFDGDGHVDGFDFLAWQQNPSLGPLSDWEASYGLSINASAATVPEPGSIALALVLAGLSIVKRRR